ncbi:hypothetical protein N7476_003537 [Penicillium atrosanguineum]|uniref:Histone acetyltransferase type B catalytic subunit n=1 Tax=Penicillium atrosanguineum TaxID=1132637 RepID=A0A9W9Q8Q3_9EURO|nr:hypothetical protein N7476_003537 [Penicillium atrosanguineum]
MFRDENDKTARRSATAKSKSEARRRFLDSERSSSSPEHSESSETNLVVLEKKPKPKAVFIPTIPVAVSSTVDEQGLNFFFHRFVTAISMLETAPPELKISPWLEAMLLHPPVRDAAISVGLAAKSNVTRDRAIRLVAKEKYAVAIGSVRVAVDNPQQANPDETFKLIVMLSLYEMVSCTTKQPDSWTVHVDGAAALLKQLAFNQTLKVFRPRPQLQYYYVSVVKYFIAEGKSTPDLLEWSPDIMSKFGPEMQPAIRLIDIMIRFMRVHYSMRSNPNIDPRTAISLTLSFESELDQWANILPQKWAFGINESSDTQSTFNGKYMVYDDTWAPRDLNHYFWARLMVNEMILLHISRLAVITPEDLGQRQLAFDTIARMGTYICAGAASQMGAHGCGVSGGGTIGSCDANDALHITVVQPGNAKPKTLSTFHPQFTYPIFGDDEQIFGYKGLIIRLRFAAHDLRPHVHISYDDRFKAVGDTAPMDLLGALKDFVPEEAFANLPDYEKAVQDDPSAIDFTPPGKLVFNYEVEERRYEIWAGSLADPKVRLLLDRMQVLVSLFIEAGTPLATDDPEWSLERWTVFFIYEKVEPPTPTASSYSIVGYATAYRYWMYLRDRNETPAVKDDVFPLPEVKVSELPSRLRIAQFLILPSHHRSGHGTHLYTTIHASCIADPTIVELTVEDPNESFDALRDTADYCLLRPEFLKHNVGLNPDPLGAYSQKKRPRSVPTGALIPTKLLMDIRTSFKIEATQFAHVLEMYLLGTIPKSHRIAGGTNLARLLIKKYKAEHENDRRYYWWRMLTKQRLYKKHKELLNELELMDRVEKLDDTVQNVEEGYEITLEALEGRLPEPEDEAPLTLSRRDKRKLTVEDDEDEEEEEEASSSKRPKV